MAAFPAMPGMSDQAGPGPDLGAILGPGATPTAQQPAVEDITRNTLRQFHNLHEQIDALARQWPEAAEEAREVKRVLTRMMVKIVASQRAPEARVPAPAVFG